MYIPQLFNGVTYKIYGQGNPDITSLSCDTSTVKQGCMFFCIKGTKFDGHNFFRKVIGDGAVAIVCEKQLDTKALQIVVEDVRAAMSVVAKNFYDNCVDKLKVVSIVGTNGKTSTSYILESILSKAGMNTAIIGTNGIFFNGHKHSNLLTTPDPIDLHYWFKQMYLNKVEVVIMETSAHAIALQKVKGLKADVAIFTNFSQDHLDFFKTMENYANVKKRYFCDEYVKNAVINIDDSLGKEISQKIGCVTYSLLNKADVTATDISMQNSKTTYKADIFGQKTVINANLVGRFNVYNMLSAIACASVLGVDVDTITAGVEDVRSVSGRNETIIRADGARIVVDFAHTPDGIDNILSYLKNTTQGNLIVVFGCGGNRDKFKRPVMAEKVSKYADFAIVTNDNPRYEDPKIIAQDIVARLSCKYKTILNRSQATEYALSIATACDTVVVLGKGAEEYQEIKGKKFPYSDMEVIRNILRI